jgi:hypothetical protein
MIIGYNYKVVHHQNHLLAEHSNLLIRTLWSGLCLDHTPASDVIVAAIPTMLCVMANQKSNTMHNLLKGNNSQYCRKM